MRFNSMTNEKPHQGLTSGRMFFWKQKFLQAKTGAAWLSSACAVKCTLNWGNMRNPHLDLEIHQETARDNREEGGDDVKSAWLLRLGPHAYYNGKDNGPQNREVELIPPKFPSVRIGVCNSTP